MADSIKKMIQQLVNCTIIPAVRYIKHRSPPTIAASDDLHRILWSRAAATSADYVEPKLNSALLFSEREGLWDAALSYATAEGLFAEFGVFEGVSINYFAKKLEYKNIRIYGFDSFEGLKEPWYGTDAAISAFDRGGELPDVLSNVELVAGWFDHTLPAFLAAHQEKVSFLHMDADTYESTHLVLDLLKDRIGQGTVIVFDEYLGFPNWQNGEFRAWQEFVAAQRITYAYIGFSLRQAAIQVQ